MQFDDTKVERIIGELLRAGVLLAAAVVLAVKQELQRQAVLLLVQERAVARDCPLALAIARCPQLLPLS